MGFRFGHNNINVRDLEKSLKFYREALGLAETRQFESADKSFKLVYHGGGKTAHKLELTWLRQREESYNLGDNKSHLAFAVDDYGSADFFYPTGQCVQQACVP